MELWSARKTFQEIGRILQLNTKTVMAGLQRFAPTVCMQAERVARFKCVRLRPEIIRLHRQGLSINAICKTLDISHPTVSKVLAGNSPEAAPVQSAVQSAA